MNEQDKLTLMEVFAGELWKATMIKNVLEITTFRPSLKTA